MPIDGIMRRVLATAEVGVWHLISRGPESTETSGFERQLEFADGVTIVPAEDAARAGASAERVSTMVDQLLDFARIRISGAIAPSRRPGNLGIIAARVVDEIESTAQNRRCDVRHEGNLDGEWDITRIDQMIASLVSNVVVRGDAASQVSVQLTGGPDDVRMTIYDQSTANGREGIDAAPDGVDPFGQAAREDGLELLVADEIVRAHGGVMRVAWGRSDGARFSVILPRSNASRPKMLRRAVMSEPIVVRAGVVVPADALSTRAVRSSGPGGQNVNKVSSKVELRVDIDRVQGLDEGSRQRLRDAATLDASGQLLVTSQRGRDQRANLDDARDKVRLLIERALFVPRRRRKTRPTRASVERRLSDKKRRTRTKADRARDDG